MIRHRGHFYPFCRILQIFQSEFSMKNHHWVPIKERFCIYDISLRTRKPGINDISIWLHLEKIFVKNRYGLSTRSVRAHQIHSDSSDKPEDVPKIHPNVCCSSSRLPRLQTKCRSLMIFLAGKESSISCHSSLVVRSVEQHLLDRLEVA